MQSQERLYPPADTFGDDFAGAIGMEAIDHDAIEARHSLHKPHRLMQHAALAAHTGQHRTGHRPGVQFTRWLTGFRLDDDRLSSLVAGLMADLVNSQIEQRAPAL